MVSRGVEGCRVGRVGVGCRGVESVSRFGVEVSRPGLRMPHWSHIGDTRPPSFPVQERGTGAVLRRCVVPLDCPCARGCVGIASRVPAANPRRRALRQKRAHDGRTPSYWPYDQVVTECLILRPRAMQVINCAAWHGQQRRQAVARRDSMAASTPNSHENK